MSETLNTDFDTHQLIKTLTQTNIDLEAAEAIAYSIRQNRQETLSKIAAEKKLASKSDMILLQHDIEKLRLTTQKEISESSKKTILSIMGLLIAQTVAIITLG